MFTHWFRSVSLAGEISTELLHQASKQTLQFFFSFFILFCCSLCLLCSWRSISLPAAYHWAILEPKALVLWMRAQWLNHIGRDLIPGSAHSQAGALHSLNAVWSLCDWQTLGSFGVSSSLNSFFSDFYLLRFVFSGSTLYAALILLSWSCESFSVGV